MAMPTPDEIEKAKETIEEDKTNKLEAAQSALTTAQNELEEAQADAIVKEAALITANKTAKDNPAEKEKAVQAKKALDTARSLVVTKQAAVKELTPLEPPATTSKPEATLDVLNGIEGGSKDYFLNGEYHVGVAVDVTASGTQSSLMIPDITGVTKGQSPVFITKPIKIKGGNLTNFLAKKKISLPEPAANLLSDTDISLNAFYFCSDQKDDGSQTVTKSGAALMSFEIAFNKGLISSLTGDDSFSELFDVTGASLRILRCDKNSFPDLQAYVKELTAKEN